MKFARFFLGYRTKSKTFRSLEFLFFLQNAYGDLLVFVSAHFLSFSNLEFQLLLEFEVTDKLLRFPSSRILESGKTQNSGISEISIFFLKYHFSFWLRFIYWLIYISVVLKYWIKTAARVWSKRQIFEISQFFILGIE